MRSLFPNALHIARREYLVRIRGRAFVITTLILAIAMVAITMIPTILAAIGVSDPPEIAVDVQTDDLTTDPVIAIQTLLVVASDPNAEPGARAQVLRADDPDTAADMVRDGELDALLTITRDGSGDLAFEYLGDGGPTSQTRVLITQAASALAIADRLERAGVSEAESAELFAPPTFTATPANPDTERDSEDFGGRYLLAYAAVILTFMAILTYGQWVAQSVAEEKSGRVMELLITAATPRQLLTGKVLGTGGAGLTQYAAIVVALAVGLMANGPVSNALGVAGSLPFELPSLGPGIALGYTAFFLLGFLLYATLYAAAGSMVSRLEDVQQVAGPLLFVAMAGYFVSFTALNAPDASWVAVLSHVPFFSPYLMPVRMLLASPSPAEIIGALALLTLTVVASIWVASRIYSAGVLMYGQRPGFRTIVRAARISR